MTISYRGTLAPAVLFAAGSFAGAAHATVYTTTTDISAANGGTNIAIGVPTSNAQFTFAKTTNDPFYYLTANGGANGVVFDGTSSAIPTSSAAFTSSVKAAGPYGSGDGYYGLRFVVGGDTLYGTALVDGYGAHISEISYNATQELSLKTSSAAPEPATWAEMILGLGAAGVALRRRQRAVAATA